MAIKWKSKTILVEPESSYGVDPTPTGAANAMLLTDVELRPMEGQDVPRNTDTPLMGAQEEIPTGIYVVLTGSFELVGSGAAGTAPAWGPLIRACGVAETIEADTSVIYNPISSAHESVAAYFYIGTGATATLHKILGGRATCVISVNAQGIPVGRVTLMGLFTTPAAATPPTPDYSDFQRPKVVTKANTTTFTIGGTAFVMRNFALDLGCDVQPRLLVNSESIEIVDKPGELISCTVEAVPMATYNPYTIANAGTPKEIILEHDTAGRKVRIESGQAVQKRLAGFENQQGVVEWPLRFAPRPDAGNDQWLITLT